MSIRRRKHARVNLHGVDSAGNIRCWEGERAARRHLVVRVVVKEDEGEAWRGHGDVADEIRRVACDCLNIQLALQTAVG